VASPQTIAAPDYMAPEPGVTRIDETSDLWWKNAIILELVLRGRHAAVKHGASHCCVELICPLRGRAGAHQSCVTAALGRNIVKLCCQA
jgi:hypothetical protein